MKLSVLDQSPIIAGRTAADAIAATLELAQAAETLGYQRYWLAEHHGLLSLADPCPEILLARIAELAELFEADEVVVLSVAPDYGVRLKSYELLARALIAAYFAACLLHICRVAPFRVGALWPVSWKGIRGFTLLTLLLPCGIFHLTKYHFIL